MMMSSQSVQQQDMYKAGTQVQYSAEYLVVDEQGNPQGQDMISLDEGDTFPEVNGINACYQMNATCMDEQCDPIGGETPEVD